MKPFVFALVAAVSILASPEVQTQTMYRCGSNYQDKPCANGQTVKVINTLKNPTPKGDTETALVIDTQCKRRGDEAQRIIWAREGGAQKNDLLAKASSEEQGKLIFDVYAVRGNSTDIRANIEKECMAEKEMSKRLGGVPDAALIKAAKELQGKMNAMEKSDSPKKDAQTEAEAASQKKHQTCAMYKLQLDIVNSNARAGADGQGMQQLSQQKRELEKEMAAKGCRN